MNTDKTVVEEFVRLVQAEDVKAVGDLLAAEPSLASAINEPLFAFGKPAIVQARNQIEMVDVLLGHGAEINARSDWEAGSYGVLNETNSDLVYLLLRRGAEFDIHAAVEHDRTDVVQGFLSEESDSINQRGPDGQFPLHYAQNVEMASLLLEAGADIDGRCLDHNSTAAHYMVCERPEVCRLLIEKGCETDIFMAAALGLEDLALGHLEREPECAGYDINHLSEYEGHIYHWKLPSVTPYQIALAKEHKDLAALIYAKLSKEEQFLASCWAANEAEARRLLEAEPQVMDSLGERERLLADAAWENMVDAVELMLKLGFDVNVRGTHQSSPLDRACVRGYLDVVEAVLPYKPALDVKNEFGGVPLTTALWGACHWREGDHVGVVSRLMKEKAPAHLGDEVDGDLGYGFLVAWMAEEGPIELVRTLLENGASPAGKNRQGETALQVATRKKRTDVVELLESHLAS